MKYLMRRPLILLLLIVLLTACFIYSPMIFGKYFLIYDNFSDIGADTMNSYIPTYTALAHKFQTKDFTSWSQYIGIGSSLFQNASIYFDPFGILISLLGAMLGVWIIPYLIVFFFILKILLSAWAIFIYLECFELSWYTKVIAGYIYSFNGFQVLWGQHYFNGTFLILCPLIFLCIEKSLTNRKYFYYLSIITAISGLSSIYQTYMILFMALLYSTVRWVQILSLSTVQKIFTHALKTASYIIIGITISSATSLPFINMLLKIGNRIDSNTSFIERLGYYFRPFDDISFQISSVLRIFSNNFNGTGPTYVGPINYYEMPQLFFSVLFPVILPIWFFNIKKRNQSKIGIKITFLAVIASLSLFISPFGSFAFHLFTYPSYRYTFVFMPIFALILAQTLDEIILKKWISNLSLSIGICFSLSCMIFAMLFYSKTAPLYLFIVNFIFIISVGIVILILWKKPKLKYYSLLGLGLILCLNISIESHITTNYRNRIPKSWVTEGLGFYDSNTIEALKYLEKIDNSYYRVDKTYHDYSYNEQALYGYRGFVHYTSSVTKGYGEFLSKYTPENFRPNVNSVMFEPLLSDTNENIFSFLGFKYVLTRSSDEELYYYLNVVDGYRFVEIAQFGEVRILQNTQKTSVGYIYQNIISESEANQKNFDQHKKNMLLNTAIIANELYDTFSNIWKGNTVVKSSEESLDKSYFDLSLVSYENCVILTDTDFIEFCEVKNDPKIFIPVTHTGQNIKNYSEVSLKFFLQESDEIQIYYQTIFRPNFSEQCSFKYYLDSGDSMISLTLPPGVTGIRIDCNKKGLIINDLQFLSMIDSIHDKVFTNGEVFIFSSSQSNILSGTTFSENAGFLCITIPFEEGWELSVDGVAQPIFPINYGFIGTKIGKGSHQIKLRYKTPLLEEGILISVIGIVVLFLDYKLRRIVRKAVNSTSD